MENIWLISAVSVVQTTLPFLLILIFGRKLLEKFWNAQIQKNALEARRQQSSEVLSLKLGAFERLVLFLERNQLNELARTISPKVGTAKELQYLMINQIRSEFEHNLSQQIYVSPDLWKLIQLGKDETIKLITLIGSKMDKNATSSDFAKELLDYVLSSPSVLPSEQALEALRVEANTFIR